jgi:hypothetical protein
MLDLIEQFVKMIEEILEVAKESIIALVEGFVVSAIIASLTSISPFFYVLLVLVNLGIIATLFEMPHWKILHLIGWIIGTWLLLGSGIVGISEILVNIIGALAIIIIKIRNEN